MAKTKQEIISDIKAYMANYPSTKYSDWYVGIAAIPRDRLFIDHSVDEKNGAWIFREAESRCFGRDGADTGLCVRYPILRAVIPISICSLTCLIFLSKFSW